MKKLIYLLLFFPFLAQAQINGTIQKTVATKVIRGSFGSSGIDSLVSYTGALTDDYILQWDNTLKKAVWVSMTASIDTTQIRTVANSLSLAQTQTALNLKANIASPTFTGVPAAPTATAGTNTTQLATTAFVTNGLASKVTSITGTTDQVIVTGTTTPVLSLPQSIATTSNLRFGSLTIGGSAPAWGSFTNMLDMIGGSIGGTSTTDFRLFSNLYYDGGNYKLRATGTGSLLDLSNGAIEYFNTSSGTAGDIKTLTSRFMVSNVGDISGAKLALIYGTGTPLNIQDGTGFGLYLANQNTLNSNWGVNASADFYINFRGYQNGTTQFRNAYISDGKGNTIAGFTGSGLGVQFPVLAGTGTRMVVANSVGDLSTQAIPGGGGGSVTGVAVANANGLSGTSDGAAVVPTLTLSTTVTGMLKGNGTAISAAVSGTDYVAPTGATLTGAFPLGSGGFFQGDATNGFRINNAANTFNNFVVADNGNATARGTIGASNLSGTNTGDQTTITGNAGTATALQTARTISGTSFDGTANITLNNTGITNGAGYITSSALSPYAPLASPALTGTPTAPTATAGTNTTQIATTAFVQSAVSGTASSGTYTPTVASIANTSEFTVYNSHYIRVGNEATVMVQVEANSTTTGAGSFSVSLPVASNMTAFTDLSGTGSTNGSFTIPPVITGDAVSDLAVVEFTKGSIGTNRFFLTFMYTVR